MQIDARHTVALAAALALTAMAAGAEKVVPIKYGDMDTWVTRHIHESGVIGGKNKTLYEVGPSTTIDGNKAYTTLGGSPWGTSNVYAKVSGVSKGSCAVEPEARPGHGRCARLDSKMDNIKVLGLVNMDVMVAGSLFLGRMLEPVTSTSNPYAKIDMGVPFTGRPTALQLDYKVQVPAADTRVKSSGFGKKKTLPGRDHAVVFVWLQRRWEEADGSIHARRVASGSRRFSSTQPWTNGARIPLTYGDPTQRKGYDATLEGLRTGDRAYYARNSRGKMVPVIEDGWDDPNATPTHVILMMSSGCSEAYVATPGMTLWVDNLAWVM